MKRDLSWDVVVAGAGVAGLSAAWHLLHQGASVLLVETQTRRNATAQCAEFVSRAVRQMLPLPERFVAQEIQGMRTWIENREEHLSRSPGLMLHRAAWEAWLEEQVRELGGTVWRGCRVEGYENGLVFCRKGQLPRRISAGKLIGADGPFSRLRQWLNEETMPWCGALQYRMPLAVSSEVLDVFFSRKYPGGYAWLFPKGREANVGLAVASEEVWQLPQLLDGFIEKCVRRGVLVDAAPLAKSGGSIPVGGLVKVLAAGGVYLAGDAAGCTHPLSGAGIYAAAASGCWAAEAASGKGESWYEAYLRSQWQQPLQKASSSWQRRREQEGRGDFSQVVRQSWMVFPEYREMKEVR